MGVADFHLQIGLLATAQMWMLVLSSEPATHLMQLTTDSGADPFLAGLKHTATWDRSADICLLPELVGVEQALLQRSSGLKRSPAHSAVLLTDEADTVENGDQVLFTTYTGKRITVAGTTVHARWSHRGKWQTFVIERPGGGAVQSGDEVSLRAHTGKRLTVQGKEVHAKWDHQGRWQKFRIENAARQGPIRNGDKVFLTAWTGKRVDADGAGRGTVEARWDDYGAWQTLVIELKARPASTATTTTTVPSVPEVCSAEWQQCGGIGWTGPKCCKDGTICDFQNDYYSSCKRSATGSSATSSTSSSTSTPSSSSSSSSSSSTSDAPQASTTSSTTSRALDDSGEWTSGTWTTGYWDCCKPSCSWPGKGSVTSPVRACNVKTGLFSDPLEKSVCDGGDSAACSNNQPFIVPGTGGRYSMAFAAGAVGGKSGLTGDGNCGQCYELEFVDKRHPNGNWGGSHPDLVGKRMVVQLTNIGYDVSGDHSFDIQIPGAGQGIFTNGCPRQFPREAELDAGAFDCGVAYGGCDEKAGCSRLPEDLRPGCEWRYDWFQWLIQGGQSNNPYISFRRVRCPAALVEISGATPTDDESYPEVDFGA